MNRTKIETYDFTWNPLGWGCYGPTGTAECLAVCPYCYAKRNSMRGMTKCPECKAFVPHFHPERLDEPERVKKPSRIFVCSTSDLFGDWVPVDVRSRVLDFASATPWHKYFFLTKNPKVMRTCWFREGAWAGVTVTNQADADERIPLLLQVPAAHRFISFEPLLGPIDTAKYPLFHLRSECKRAISWVIIGAQTGVGAKPVDPDWVFGLTEQCMQAGIPVFHKNSLAPIFPTPGLMHRDLP